MNLAVQAQGGIYSTVGQAIPYTYVVTNTGTSAIPGPITIVDDKAGASCPNVNTVGNKDNNLDGQESLTCTASYAITQADLNAGAVTSNTIAKAGGVDSKKITTTVPITLSKVLVVTYTTNPTTYSQAGQTLTFTYSIKNTGTVPLGPTQFVISNDKLGALPCLGTATSLAANESISCTTTYTISPNDVTVNQLAFNVIATGGGAGAVQPTSLVIANTNIVTNPGATPSSNFTRGSSIQHKVVDGEWMLQIARCYGADFNTVKNANPQVVDPNKIWPISTLNIPNIGSNGNIYGPPCITYYTAQNGDTWNSIAQKYNADIAVLQEANYGVTLANGVKLKIPLNSANGNPVPAGVEPIRLSIPNASQSGTVSQQSKVRYVLTATQGQTLNVKLTAPVNEVALTIAATNGTVLKPQDANQTWSGIIPVNSDYYIDVISVQTTTTKNFTLETSLSSSASAAFERVADINTGAGDSNPSYFAIFNGALYFQAIGSDNTGAELWKYDPITKAASRIADIFAGPTGSNPSFLTPYNNQLYFSANGNDGSGVELWRFNGSAIGRLGDINKDAGNANPAYMAVYNNELYFSANGNDGAGTELWKTDGTNTTRAADIYPGPSDSNPAYLTVYNNILYFSAITTDGGNELWKYDGTKASLVLDINSGAGNSNPAYLTVFNNILYFSANGNNGLGTELWKYDGTNAGIAADINVGAGDSGPTFLTVFNNALYFSALGDSAGTELWKYDGTSAKRVSDINTNGNSNPAFMTVFDNALFFQANGGDGVGVELWKFKGP